MNRYEEYTGLLAQLDCAPPRLEYTLQRVTARRRRSRAGRWCGIPVASLTGVFAAFVLLVNCIPSFALACGTVSALRDLTAAVAFSPSLKAAVEHDYAQYVGLQDTDGALTMTVDYLIVDQKQVNVAFRLEGTETGTWYDVHPSITGAEGEDLPGSRVISYGWGPDSTSGLFTLDFDAATVPDRLQLTVRLLRDVLDGAPEPAADFSFALRLDPTYTAAGELLTVGKTLVLDGQTIRVDTVEILPTHIRVNLLDDPENSAWLRSLSFFLVDEAGTRYEKSGGITATGDPGGTPFMSSHRLESSWFSNADHLTLCITGVSWLEKDRQQITVDLTTGEADWLPEPVRLTDVRREGDDVLLSVVYEDQPGFVTTSILDYRWLDPEGGEHSLNGYHAFTDPETGHSCVTVRLTDCPWEQVVLTLSYSRVTLFDIPVELPLG